MTWLRGTIAVGVGIYILLCAVALNGSTTYSTLLVVPPILLLMIAGGNWLTTYMGLPARKQQFRQRDDDEPS